MIVASLRVASPKIKRSSPYKQQVSGCDDGDNLTPFVTPA